MVPRFDGSKATKELGIQYTPLEVGVSQRTAHISITLYSFLKLYGSDEHNQPAQEEKMPVGPVTAMWMTRVDARRALCVRHTLCTDFDLCV